MFLFFLIIDLYFLIPAVIAQNFFNSIADFVIPITIPSKEAKAAIEIHPVIIEAKIRKCQYN